MEDIQEVKKRIRNEVAGKIQAFEAKELAVKTRSVHQRLFEFANFLEAGIVLLYMHRPCEISTREIIQFSQNTGKTIVLPVFESEKFRVRLWKVDNLTRCLKNGHRGIPEPDPSQCKTVPMDCVDIALIPGIAFDEKGGRVGYGEGYYDRLIPKLDITTRKVGMAFEEQVYPQVPMASNDRHVDIIITERRTIYKI